jgi:large subunit ribosomal protein L3
VGGVVKDIKPLVFAAYKAGMTHVLILDKRKGSVTQGQEVSVPVTVLDCPPLVVCGIKLYRYDMGAVKDAGLVWAEKFSKDFERKIHAPKNSKTKEALEKAEKQLESLADVRLIVHTKPRESGIGKKKPELFEIDISGDVKSQWNFAKEKLGKEISISDVFSEGEYIDVKAIDKGKGYQGVVKRFGVKIRGRKHGEKKRHIGSLGPQNPPRVIPGKIAMAGQLGFQPRTEYNKVIFKIGSEGIAPKGGFTNYGVVPKNYALIQGSLPGSKKRLVFLRKATRSMEKKEPVEIKYVSLESQQ